MALGYAYTLFCDRRGCRAKVTIADTRSADHARRVARARHGWSCDAAGDYCPNDREARATAHLAQPQGAGQ
ncbi:hypothetical protein ACYF6T_39090 [Streptomyces sp. 7R007]